MKIFVTHYTPLTERKRHILNQFNNQNITEYEFIESHDREQLTHDELNMFTKINNAERSLFLKHVEILKKINETNEENGITLVFEDDAVLVHDFNNKLNEFLKQLPENFDLIFPGECCNLHVFKIQQNNYFYINNTSRGTCFYIINNNSVKKILEKFKNDTLTNKKISLPIDWWFNKIIPELNLNSYWTEPTLVYQGSELGIFKTTIR
jgi:GR25 family glycosyltransferase involved in LPS biosynthesis